MNPVPGIVAPVESLNAASRRAHLAAETHLERLTSEYHTVIARAGRHAAQGFSDMNAHGLVAADPPPGWKDVPAEDLVDVTYVKSQLVDATRATRTAAAQDAMMPLMQALGISFTLQPPMVADLVARSGRRAANMSVPGILDAVRAAIRQGFEEGLSVPQVAQLIRSKCDDLAGYQAEMLARTDLIGTANGGSIIAAKTVYPEGTLTKSWLNATDSRVINDGRIRPTHLEANAQQVGLDDHFVVGDDKLLFPGDPDGSDAEVINCRCTLIYAETEPDVLTAAPSGGSDGHWVWSDEPDDVAVIADAWDWHEEDAPDDAEVAATVASTDEPEPVVPSDPVPVVAAAPAQQIVLQPQFTIVMPEYPKQPDPIVIPAPVVTVEAPPPAEVNVTVEAPPPAEVNVTVAAAEPIVIPAPEVTVQSPNVEVVVERQPARKVEFERDAGGRIVSADITEEES